MLEPAAEKLSESEVGRLSRAAVGVWKEWRCKGITSPSECRRRKEFTPDGFHNDCGYVLVIDWPELFDWPESEGA